MVQISFLICLGTPILWAECIIKDIPLNIGPSEDLSILHV
jgi:hypothetical protein